MAVAGNFARQTVATCSDNLNGDNITNLCALSRQMYRLQKWRSAGHLTLMAAGFFQKDIKGLTDARFVEGALLGAQKLLQAQQAR